MRWSARSYLGSVALAGGLLTLPTLGATSARAQGATREAPIVPATPAIVPLESELEAAERAFAELRLDEAARLIDTVRMRLGDEEGARWTSALRAHVHVLAAAIARARGELEACDAALDAALAIEPALRLDPALHPPPLLEALERRRARRDASTPTPLPETDPRDGVPITSIPIDPVIVDPGPNDPWPWVGLGVGAALLVGGAIALSVVLSTPPSSFDVRGTIVP